MIDIQATNKLFAQIVIEALEKEIVKSYIK